MEAVDTEVDALTLVISGAQATKFLRILNYADKLSSAANVCANYTEQDNPVLSQFLAITSGVLGIGNLTANGVNKFRNLANGSNNVDDILSLVTRNGDELATSHEQAIIDLLEVVDDNTSTELLAVLGSDKGKQSLIDLLEAEEEYLRQLNRSSLADQVKLRVNVLKQGTNGFFSNVNEFAATFDPSGAVSQVIRQQAFDYYNTQNWSALENLFNQNGLNGGWPPANGGYNIVDNIDLKAGMKFDRYGGAIGGYNGSGTPNLGGNYTSPMPNGTSYSFGQRALNQPETAYDFYYEIEILQDLPFKGQNADVIPWFNQVGDGQQTMWKIPIDPVTGYPKTWNKLAQEGYIKITIKGSPSGNYSNLVGTIIQ